MNKCMNRLVKRSIKIITENNETINITPNSPLLPDLITWNTQSEMHHTTGVHSPGHQILMALKVLGTDARASSVPDPVCPVLMTDQIKPDHTKFTWFYTLRSLRTFNKINSLECPAFIPDWRELKGHQGMWEERLRKYIPRLSRKQKSPSNRKASINRIWFLHY